MVYGLAWRACYGVWCGLVGIAWCMVWPVGPCMVYNMAWRASHGIMVWPGGPGMGYGMALRVSHGIVCPCGYRMLYGMTWRA